MKNKLEIDRIFIVQEVDIFIHLLYYKKTSDYSD